MDETTSFGWACYWKLKTKDDEIRILRDIIKNSNNEECLKQLICLDEKLKVEKLKKEQRKVNRELRKAGLL